MTEDEKELQIQLADLLRQVDDADGHTAERLQRRIARLRARLAALALPSDPLGV